MNNNIQALRALAAYGVVAHHIIYSLNAYVGRCDIHFNMGATGVDVFRNQWLRQGRNNAPAFIDAVRIP